MSVCEKLSRELEDRLYWEADDKGIIIVQLYDKHLSTV